MLLTKLYPEDMPYSGSFDPEITGITADSRQVQPGYLFVALAGVKLQGSQFIESAIQAGAVVVVTDEEVNFPYDPAQLAHIKVANPRLFLSRLAARFYPRQPEQIVAVTGTNGKTSTAHFCRMIWQELGIASASIGTIGVIDEKDSFAAENGTSLTTPDPVKLHQVLDTMVERGIYRVAMEASSHGLDQYRLDGVQVQAAAFTNLSRDHLDYHPSYEAYLEAKMALFGRVMAPGGVAVLNADIPEYPAIVKLCKERNHAIITYGWEGETIRLLSTKPNVHGQEVVIRVLGEAYTVALGLVGEFQVMNILAALGLVIASGIAPEDAVATLEHLPSVPGRMEKVPVSLAGSAIFVDYAHTPDALEKALMALRPHTEGRLLVVFGCGGDRDKGKRPEMGSIAARLADIVIVTDDNPRSEDPATIRKEVLAGCPEAIEIGDRKEAIGYAVDAIQPGDIVLLAGKGHEKMQIMKDGSIPFDDLAIAIQKGEEKKT